MGKEEKKPTLNFEFECEHCGENWRESLLDLIDRCNPEELQQILNHIQAKK